MKRKYEKELAEIFKILKSTNNKDCFEKFYSNYNILVYKIAFTILKNKDDSEDVVQTVFSKIYTLSKDKLPTKHILSWIYSVTKNESVSLLRKKKNTLNIDDIYSITDDTDEISNSIDIIEFNRLISKLDNAEKEIVSLKILSNLSFDEISKLLNNPTGTVKWKYYKSLHTLKLLFSNLGMFIITFIIGLKTMKVTPKGVPDYQSNSLENKTNVEKEQQSNQSAIEESTQYNSTNMQDIFEEMNTAEKEKDTNEEIQVEEHIANINNSGIGIMAVSFIFLLITIILLINFIKYQLKRKEKASK